MITMSPGVEKLVAPLIPTIVKQIVVMSKPMLYNNGLSTLSARLPLKNKPKEYVNKKVMFITPRT